MNIPTEYYEDEFLQFEELMQSKKKQKCFLQDDLHGPSEYLLRQYNRYQKDLKIPKAEIGVEEESTMGNVEICTKDCVNKEDVANEESDVAEDDVSMSSI